MIIFSTELLKGIWYKVINVYPSHLISKMSLHYHMKLKGLVPTVYSNYVAGEVQLKTKCISQHFAEEVDNIFYMAF